MIKTMLTLERFSPRGDPLEKREQESRSWLKHFFDLLYTQCAVLAQPTNDIASVSKNVAASPLYQCPVGTLMVASPPGNTQVFIPTFFGGYYMYCSNPRRKGNDVGIMVGTGNNPVTPVQDALQTRVAHGEAAGQLLHGGTELYGLTFANPNGQFTIRRYFTNVLGGNISIQEVGIYSPGLESPFGGLTAFFFCIARDVVAPAVVVANGEILRVTYVPAITV
jgi:hypothetical protein